jgi:UDP-glucose 4-epimerase
MRQLAEQGETVVSVSTSGSLDDGARQFLGNLGERVVCVKADILDLGEIRRYSVKTVVHGAAITAIGELEREIPHQAVMVNVGGTATILEASRGEGIKRFIYLSSATVYGSGDPRIPIGEEVVPNPTGIYAITKRAGEEIVSRYFDLFRMDGTIVRISAPYGPLERPSGRRTVMSPLFGWCQAALTEGKSFWKKTWSVISPMRSIRPGLSCLHVKPEPWRIGYTTQAAVAMSGFPRC